MRLFYWGKDGGKDSTVWGFWLVELKSLFSVALLKFVGDSRDVFHTHAFNSVSWVLKGKLLEHFIGQPGSPRAHTPSLHPIVTPRYQFHKVDSEGVTYVLTLRGPWVDAWQEYDPYTNKFTLLSHGRVVV